MDLSSPRCSHCGTEHSLERLRALSLLTSPAVVGMAFACACEHMDVVLLPVSSLLDVFPTILALELGLGEGAKLDFLRDLEGYGHG